MDFSELIKNRRSIRDYKDKAVALETIQEIIKQSCLSPSSGNRQEWRFVIIKNRDMMKRISDDCKYNVLKDIEANPNLYESRYRKSMENEAYNVFYNAPCLIIILGPKNNHSKKIDCTLLSCYIMFSAVARGMGTGWVGLGYFLRSPELLKELGITEDLAIVSLLTLGYPKRIPEATPRKDPQILRVID